MQEVAQHPGIVSGTSRGIVNVKIEVHSACGSCSAHAHCGFAESSERELEVETPLWQEYHEGQRVIVTINESLGFLAVVWAYLLPAVLLLGTIIPLLIVLNNELLAVSISLAVVALYYGILYLFRHRLQKKFTFDIEPE